MTESALPLVTVCISTYQHGSFIRQCVESVLAQQTDFDFEIVIGEDESTDGTREECQLLAAKFPGKIRLLLHERKDVLFINRQPTGRANFMKMVQAANGKYIALCEGDDFWIDQLKLQKQVSYLEANPDCAMVCAHAKKVDESGAEKDQITMPEKERFTISDLAQANFIFTASSVFRAEQLKAAIEMPDFRITLAGDYFIEMIAASHGYIQYFREVQVAWRIHGGGAWGNKPLPVQLLNGLYCQYLMIRNLPGQTEACAFLEKTVYDSIQKLFSTANYNLNESLERFKDEPFRTMMHQRYNEFIQAKKKKENPQRSLLGRLKDFLK